MTPEHEALLSVIASKGLVRRDEPFQLSSGEWSRDYIDGKVALAHGEDLKLAAEVVLQLAARRGVGFDAVGGLTMGSDPLAYGVAIVGSKEWFSVRKGPKGHGRKRRIEGTVLTADHRVVLVEDVVTTGGSMLQALEAVEEAGASVVLAVTLVDRGRSAQREFTRRGVAYEPVATYETLGIDPVGGAAVGTAPSG